MLSVVIPSYKNPEYLDLCLASIIKTQINQNEIVVVLDGFLDLYTDLKNKYKDISIKWVNFTENMGLPMALNVGVYEASNEKILIVNEDNVFCKSWDKILEEIYNEFQVISIMQYEPEPGSIFGFPCKNFGMNPKDFKMTEWLEFQKTDIENIKAPMGGHLLPIFMNKKYFMAVGGWDTTFVSPFVVDLDFFAKLELIGLEFTSTVEVSFYHFGSRSTKKRDDGKESSSHFALEREAAAQFQYKWKFPPQRRLSDFGILPQSQEEINGVKFGGD